MTILIALLELYRFDLVGKIIITPYENKTGGGLILIKIIHIKKEKTQNQSRNSSVQLVSALVERSLCTFVF